MAVIATPPPLGFNTSVSLDQKAKISLERQEL